ncbi:uncharacterized protein MONBRDRAFT_10594 [Monosiga brevicollis MX1]|uniref:SH2 domain-containing protein n=1 Tax=Monosiga brevicollis TaxID=81824 RepID=A9V6U2_MONBE|nr:uncharacterized protein MONBRDRAFT_10594 [Monosiga brevicollis MX1]EDQ86866.1 predicted protein [Monosiga brevicollis MX1]|eukprot:XP_001748411.1 hypothetical protein [Monosiga brevicollis MX1]
MFRRWRARHSSPAVIAPPRPESPEARTGAAKWSTRDVGRWLESVHMSELKRSFKAHRIDGNRLLALHADDLTRLGLESPSQQRLLLHNIQQLRIVVQSSPDHGPRVSIVAAQQRVPVLHASQSSPLLNNAPNPLEPSQNSRDMLDFDPVYAQIHEVAPGLESQRPGEAKVLQDNSSRGRRPRYSSVESGDVDSYQDINRSSDSSPSPSVRDLHALYSTVSKGPRARRTTFDTADLSTYNKNSHNFNAQQVGRHSPAPLNGASRRRLDTDPDFVSRPRASLPTDPNNLGEHERKHDLLIDSLQSANRHTKTLLQAAEGAQADESSYVPFIDEEALRGNYFNDQASRHVVQDLVRQRAQRGAFGITVPGSSGARSSRLLLTVAVAEERIEQLPIFVAFQGLRLYADGPAFSRLAVLVEYYRHHPLPLSDVAEDVCLSVGAFDHAALADSLTLDADASHRQTGSGDSPPAWFVGELDTESCQAVLRYERDGCYFVRLRPPWHLEVKDPAARLHQVTSRRADDAGREPCEVVYLNGGQVGFALIDMSPLGICLHGHENYHESLAALLEQLRARAEELPVKLTYTPGDLTTLVDERARRGSVDLGFSDRGQHSLQLSPQDMPQLLSTLIPEGWRARWWLEAPLAVQRATALLRKCPDGTFFIRHGAQLGYFVLTYVVHGRLETESIMAFSASRSRPRPAVCVVRASSQHYKTLSRLVQTLSQPSSRARQLLLCPLARNDCLMPARLEAVQLTPPGVSNVLQQPVSRKQTQRPLLQPPSDERLEPHPSQERERSDSNAVLAAEPGHSAPATATSTPPHSPMARRRGARRRSRSQSNDPADLPTRATNRPARLQDIKAVSAPSLFVRADPARRSSSMHGTASAAGRSSMVGPGQPGGGRDIQRSTSLHGTTNGAGEAPLTVREIKPILKNTRHPFFQKRSKTDPARIERSVAFANSVERVEIPAVSDWYWYQAGKPRSAAIQELDHCPDGAFIIRRSESNPACFALTYKALGRFWDELVVVPSGSLYGPGIHFDSDPRLRFRSLEELVQYYAQPSSPLISPLIVPDSFFDSSSRSSPAPFASVVLQPRGRVPSSSTYETLNHARQGLTSGPSSTSSSLTRLNTLNTGSTHSLYESAARVEPPREPRRASNFELGTQRLALKKNRPAARVVRVPRQAAPRPARRRRSSHGTALVQPVLLAPRLQSYHRYSAPDLKPSLASAEAKWLDGKAKNQSWCRIHQPSHDHEAMLALSPEGSFIVRDPDLQTQPQGMSSVHVATLVLRTARELLYFPVLQQHKKGSPVCQTLSELINYHSRPANTSLPVVLRQ